MRRSLPGHRTWSPVFWLVVVAGLLSASAVAAGAGPDPGQKDAKDFLGLWQGVDPLDGSPVRLSLSDIDDDGVMELTMQEDFYTTCFNLGPTYSRGRGVVTGTATVASKNVLDTTTDLICIDDSNVHHSQGVAPVQYTLKSHGRVLLLPPFGNSPGIVLHHIAQ
jgi:hypothetical protein